MKKEITKHQKETKIIFFEYDVINVRNFSIKELIYFTNCNFFECIIKQF